MSVETIDNIFETYFEKKRELDVKYEKLEETIKMMEKKMEIGRAHV